MNLPNILQSSRAVVSFVCSAIALAAAVDLRAATIVWDGGGASDNWTTPENWAANNAPMPNDSLVFDGATRLTPTNNFPVDTSFSGLAFPATAAAFILGGNSITLNGSITNDSPARQTVNLPMTLASAQNITVGAGSALAIGGVISGTGNLTKSGDGVLELNGVNSYVGETVLEGGTVTFGANNTVGNLIFGAADTEPFSTISSSLNLGNAHLTASSLNIRVNSGVPNTITIGSGKTLTINGPVAVGPNTAGLPISNVSTAVNVLGTGGSLVVTTTDNFSVGLPRLNADPNPDPFTTVDISGLSNFTYDAGVSAGELRVGGGNSRGILLLANTSNTITAAVVHVSNSAVAAASGNNNGGTSRLGLGLGSNIIRTNVLNVGGGKSPGIFDFQGETGTLTLTGQDGGTSTVNITIGSASSATGSNTVTQFLLAGHTTNIQAGTVIIGRLAGATGGTGGGNLTFDTGTFHVASLQLAVNTSGTAPNGAAGTFTLGTDNTSTGVLNVTGEFFLANRTNTASVTNPAVGTFIMNGGTANIDTDIIDASTAGDASTRNTTFTLAGGTLNMMGHAIGSATAPITTVNLPALGQSATLANLGGAGINGTGLVLNGGTLNLEGTNSFTGSTTVADGTLLITGTLTGTTALNVTAGTLRLGAADRVVDTATISLANGTFNSAGFNEALGLVSITASAAIDLGTGASILHFADSTAVPWSGTLSIRNWSGAPGGGGVDQIFFGNSDSALTPGQLSVISFVDPFGPGSGNVGARILTTGELVAIPEPCSAALAILGSAIFGRRKARTLRRA